MSQPFPACLSCGPDGMSGPRMAPKNKYNKINTEFWPRYLMWRAIWELIELSVRYDADPSHLKTEKDFALLAAFMDLFSIEHENAENKYSEILKTVFVSDALAKIYKAFKENEDQFEQKKKINEFLKVFFKHDPSLVKVHRKTLFATRDAITHARGSEILAAQRTAKLLKCSERLIFNRLEVARNLEINFSNGDFVSEANDSRTALKLIQRTFGLAENDASKIIAFAERLSKKATKSKKMRGLPRFEHWSNGRWTTGNENFDQLFYR